MTFYVFFAIIWCNYLGGLVMDNKYLVINGGSSSLKFSLYNINKEEMVNGYIQKIGLEDSFYTLKYDGKKVEKNCKIMNHIDACNVMINELL